MAENFRARLVLAAPLVASGLLVSGCMSSPTYGTDKTANEQLVGDLSGILSFKPKTNPVGEYKPRPELVKPASATELPAPQENIVTASSEAWPESPEQKRARIRQNATENRDKPGFEAEIVNDISPSGPAASTRLGGSDHAADAGIITGADTKKQREEFNRRLAENRQGSATKRKYLSEPPLEYRTPAQTAAADDIGEDEAKKERRIKKAARKKTGGWRDIVPWL